MEKKKLFCVPLVPQGIPDELSNRYWAEVQEQIDRSEMSFGKITRLYHEANDLAGEPGLKNIQTINEKGSQFIKKTIEKGAELQPLEDRELLLQIVDCQIFLGLRFLSMEVSEKISKLRPEILEIYGKAIGGRREHILRQISETLKEGETGMLLMADEERIQLQFPPDIDVILVRPPVLSEIEKWQTEAEKERMMSNESNDP